MSANPTVRDSPTYWFVLMEEARARGRFIEAQQALEELRRLGIEVRFRGGKPVQTGGPKRAS